jgi:hypothetical protein
MNSRTAARVLVAPAAWAALPRWGNATARLVACLVCGPLIVKAHAETAVRVAEVGGKARIENDRVAVEYDLSTGTYRMVDKKEDVVCLSEASISAMLKDRPSARERLLVSSAPGLSRNWKSREENHPALGKGKTLIVNLAGAGAADTVLICEIALYEQAGCVVLNAGIKNTATDPIQMKGVTVAEAKAYPGRVPAERRILDGGQRIKNVGTKNNILVTFRDGGKRRSLVLGGLTYHEFEKFAQVKDPPVEPVAGQTPPNGFGVSLGSSDFVGKRVDGGQTYVPDDRFYVDFTEPDPFEALEKYARVVRDAQGVRLNCCDFPEINLWYAGGEGGNTTVGGVAAMEDAVKSGFTKYCRVGVRVEPDYYVKKEQPNTHQGWWDDEHWQRKECGEVFRPPYETAAKFARAIRDLGGVPMIYFQTARRSRDYADTYPGHMLHNDAKNAPDFTDPDFTRHMKEVYANLRAAGLLAVKYDYPSEGQTQSDSDGDHHDLCGCRGVRVGDSIRPNLQRKRPRSVAGVSLPCAIQKRPPVGYMDPAGERCLSSDL